MIEGKFDFTDFNFPETYPMHALPELAAQQANDANIAVLATVKQVLDMHRLYIQGRKCDPTMGGEKRLSKKQKAEAIRNYRRPALRARNEALKVLRHLIYRSGVSSLPESS